MHVLALSPHLDDAVFSAGALLGAHAALGHTVTVATAFTQSIVDCDGFALACQTDKGYAPGVDYMALRRAEDTEACRQLGLDYEHWDLPEAPHWGYGSPAELFAGARETDGAVVDALAQNVRAALGRHRPDVVLYPRCIGDHVDHLQLAAAVARVRRSSAEGAPRRWLRWYDQPYLARHRARYPEVGEARLAHALTDVSEPGLAYGFTFGTEGGVGGRSWLARKADACAAYVSQVGYQFYGAVGEPVGAPVQWPSRIAGALGEREYLVTA